ncbi:hypothetical protein VZT92_017394 [Zoarces viviparus]|uniref:Immunoglobulin V-set domain-containing protein n=1 Tax=Zoarces viviparus TaxID=48416 RepID=A0AAW1ER47_ZOAVI
MMSYREKMICSILLLITLTSCVSAGPLVVDVTQRSYQAEENHNVTLEWTFKTTTDGSLKSINIFCEMFTDLRPFTLFYLDEGVEVSKSQHERFAGRVQFDKDVLREGRLRLHMSRLRTNDSGDYQCGVSTGDGWNSRKCHLNVTAERVRPKPERDPSPTGSPSQPPTAPDPVSHPLEPDPVSHSLEPDPMVLVSQRSGVGGPKQRLKVSL